MLVDFHPPVKISEILQFRWRLTICEICFSFTLEKQISKITANELAGFQRETSGFTQET
jgi:hypothetical protein